MTLDYVKLAGDLDDVRAELGRHDPEDVAHIEVELQFAGRSTADELAEASKPDWPGEDGLPEPARRPEGVEPDTTSHLAIYEVDGYFDVTGDEMVTSRELFNWEGNIMTDLSSLSTALSTLHRRGYLNRATDEEHTGRGYAYVLTSFGAAELDRLGVPDTSKIRSKHVPDNGEMDGAAA